MAVAVVVTILTVRNAAGDVIPPRLYVPTNVVLTGILALIAVRVGLSADDLGLARSTARKGLRVGAVAAALVAFAVGLGAATPTTRSLFEDQRVTRVDSVPELAYEALVRIPIGTVVFEEFAFRGILLALLTRARSVSFGVGVSSLLFGLWHIRPTTTALDTNDLAVGVAERITAVSAAVVVTSVAGAIFCAFRIRTQSLLAPMVVHISTNSFALLAAYTVLHHGGPWAF